MIGNAVLALKTFGKRDAHDARALGVVQRRIALGIASRLGKGLGTVRAGGIGGRARGDLGAQGSDTVMRRTGLIRRKVDIKIEQTRARRAIDNSHAGDITDGCIMLGQVAKELGDGKEDGGIVLLDRRVFLDAKGTLKRSAGLGQ